MSPYEPRRVELATDDSGTPVMLGRRRVEAVNEEWVVSDRWWTEAPIRRHYFEVVLANGACVTVYRDLVKARWLQQRT